MDGTQNPAPLGMEEGLFTLLGKTGHQVVQKFPRVCHLKLLLCLKRLLLTDDLICQKQPLGTYVLSAPGASLGLRGCDLGFPTHPSICLSPLETIKPFPVVIDSL